MNDHLDKDQEGNSILGIADSCPSSLLLELGLDQICALPKHKGIERLDVGIKEGLALDKCIKSLVKQALVQPFCCSKCIRVHRSSWSGWLWYSEFGFCINGCSDIPTILKHSPDMLQQFLQSGGIFVGLAMVRAVKDMPFEHLTCTLEFHLT